MDKLRQISFIVCNSAKEGYVCEQKYNGWFHTFAQYADADGAEMLAICESESGDIIETYTTYIKFEDWI